MKDYDMALAERGNKNYATVNGHGGKWPLNAPDYVTPCGFWGALCWQSAFMGPNYTMLRSQTHTEYGMQSALQACADYDKWSTLQACVGLESVLQACADYDTSLISIFFFLPLTGAPAITPRLYLTHGVSLSCSIMLC